MSQSQTASALRESNSPRQLGRLEPLPIGQGHIEAEGGRVELPRRCCARPHSKRVPSPVGLSFRRCKLQQKGSNLHPLLNRQVDYRYRMLETNSVRVVRFELTISGFRYRRIPRLSHTLNEAPSGSRTRTSALARQQAAATSWVQTNVPNCQRAQDIFDLRFWILDCRSLLFGADNFQSTIQNLIGTRET